MLVEANSRQLEEALTRRAQGASMIEASGLHPASEQVERMVALAEALATLPGPAPHPGARVRVRNEFVEAIAGHRSAWVHSHQLRVRPARHRLPTHRVRWTLVLFVALLLALLAGSGLALAAQIADPDSPLYPAKVTSERLLIGLSRGPVAKASVRLQVANQRFREAESMAAKGDSKLTLAALGSYYDQLRLSGAELAASRRDAVWDKVRDQFDKAEAKPVDVIITQLRARNRPEGAARAQALQTAFNEDRKKIDPMLKKALPGRPSGPQPLPSGAPPGQPPGGAPPGQPGAPTP
ncbi:MAG: DUF5667 domain-containing protein [Candidatus Dormibacteraeota bacterium]|nr:DUF5667 domain-containing protein [Candidatus Dormibacteraeota bacterium]